MILILHVTTALASIGYGTYAYVSPSISRLIIACSLVFSTLVSGFYLVLNSQTNIGAVCITGLSYLGFVSYLILSARNKLAYAVKK